MSETERRQTTKGIWMSKNKRDSANGGATKMADNILVMDVEGTDGRERGEDQDFERKSALFASGDERGADRQHLGAPGRSLPGSEHGSAQDCFRGQLAVVPERQAVRPEACLHLYLFSAECTDSPSLRRSQTRSLLFFVIRDHIGNTPLENLRNTLIQDLSKLWSAISKPRGARELQDRRLL